MFFQIRFGSQVRAGLRWLYPAISCVWFFSVICFVLVIFLTSKRSPHLPLEGLSIWRNMRFLFWDSLSGCFCMKTWMINHLCSGSMWQGQSKVHCGEVCWQDYWCCTACNTVRFDKKDMLSLPSSTMNNGLYVRAVHRNPNWPHLQGRTVNRLNKCGLCSC